ncbi:MAG: phosphoribosylformylglycinamidine synthase subunit PurL [Ignavibacteria bacterium]|nr:phosphoribosylformylglycinamidine synthase subunit PurL [Ignavibacteria bacterium]
MQEPEVNLELAKTFGLVEEEYNRILEILGRTPSYTELGIYSVMWSEHCSYKNSILEIKKLPRSGKRLLVGAGEENAGLVDIGDGLAVAFKIESHNHPSAVEPYQGAATGIGGILRDIFTMGARPIAALNSLRFGNINDESGTREHAPLSRNNLERSKFLFKNVVKGIGDYGNCFGVPTVSGEIYFDECYRDNPLVNAMAVGIVRHSEVATAAAKGEGNPVFIVGSSTGRDGIHGATFASEEISEASEAKRPSVQVGDPFTEKLLLEASLELIKSRVVVGMQDMGAAGITCSTTEMSAKTGMGMDINLDFVPAREENMSAYELMLSESQERMLVVIEKGKEDTAKKIFDKWDLNCVQIGTVTKGPFVKVSYQGKVVAEVPANTLVLGGDAPVYKRESKRPAYLDELQNFDFDSLTEPEDYNEVLLRLLSSPNIANKNWVYEQYDTQVRTNTIVMPGGDASVVRIKGTKKALAMKTDCNGRYVYLNPYKGGMIAVCEAARNVACTGAEPLAITNCLNFGNPYKPEVYYQFTEAIRGIGDACRTLNTPVTGGNVSFYNESPDYAVYPTPTIGMVGLIENIDNVMTSYFKNKGDVIAIIGTPNESKKNYIDGLGGCEYVKMIHGLVTGDAPTVNLGSEKNLINCIITLINSKFINSAHDVSDGGLAVALAESCLMNRTFPIGCNVNIKYRVRKDFVLFNESQSWIVISYEKQNESEIARICKENDIIHANIGVTGGDSIKINDDIKLTLYSSKDAYYDSIRKVMEN